MELAKGTRDFPPEIQLIREYLFRRCRKAFERHGFSPFASPTIERKETLTFKFGGDEDVMKELFLLSDQGERELGLRFDLTVPLCRFVAQNKDLKLPFKRYEIGRVYRDGPIKLGRYREFWQCDADIVGSGHMLSDAECIKTASDILSALPFEYVIKVNNRKLLEAIITYAGIINTHKAMIAIDKLAKQGPDAVKKELLAIATSEEIDKLFSLLTVEGTDNGKLKHIEQAIGECEGIMELREVLTYLTEQAHVQFDPTLARGLNYYTGTVYEGFLLNSNITSSVCGGGRYDNIIGAMVGENVHIPAVGISIGIDPLTDALLSEKQRFDKTPTKVFIAPIKTTREAAQIADKLRARGINVDVDVMERSISKNLDYTDKLGIPFIIIVGAKDLAEECVTLRNMQTGEEHKIPLSELDTIELDAY